MNINPKTELEDAIWNTAETFFLSGQIDESTFNSLIGAVGEVLDATE